MRLIFQGAFPRNQIQPDISTNNFVPLFSPFDGLYSSGSSGRVRGRARNIKSMQPPLAAIFL